MKLTRIATIVVCCLFLSACATGELMTRMRPGMTKQEVVDLLGQPDGYSAPEGYEVFKYTNRLISGWSYDRADYNVILKGDIVKEYGAGEVRTKQSGVNAILFINPY